MDEKRFAELEKKLKRIEKVLLYLANDSHDSEPITPRKLYFSLQKEKVID
jgi:hypothetical protein